MINQKRCKVCGYVYDFAECPNCRRLDEYEELNIKDIKWK